MSTIQAPQGAHCSAPTVSSTSPPASVPDWKTAYPPEAWRRIRGEGIYPGSLLVLAAAVTVVIMSFSERLAPHKLTQNILCCALGGITGSWIYCVKWSVRAVTNKIWRYDLIIWRLVSPFLGIFLAVSVYVVLETGLMGITFTRPNAPAGGSDPKQYAYAIGFLVGLFSDDVMGKLTEVAKTLFGRSATTKQPVNEVLQEINGKPNTKQSVEMDQFPGHLGSAPGVTRTRGPRFRKPLLYPPELQAHSICIKDLTDS
jgi:hypothetical protein